MSFSLSNRLCSEKRESDVSNSVIQLCIVLLGLVWHITNNFKVVCRLLQYSNVSNASVTCFKEKHSVNVWIDTVVNSEPFFNSKSSNTCRCLKCSLASSLSPHPPISLRQRVWGRNLLGKVLHMLSNDKRDFLSCLTKSF